MHKAIGPEVQALDHPALNLTAAREVITVAPGNQTISALIQRPASVMNAANQAAATRLLAQGY